MNDCTAKSVYLQGSISADDYCSYCVQSMLCTVLHLPVNTLLQQEECKRLWSLPGI